MAGLNKLSVIGNLGRDPELRHTKNDKQVTSFSVAMDSGWGDSKETLWVDVSCWGKLAEVASQYLTKGSKVYVEGEVGLNVFPRKNGDPGATITLNASKLVMLSSRENGNGNGRSDRQPVGAGSRSRSSSDDFEDMPF